MPDSLVRSFLKLDPKLNEKIVNQAITYFGGKNTAISQKDFTFAFESTEKRIPNRPATAKPTSKADQLAVAIRKLDQVMFQEGIAPVALFKKADTNGDGLLIHKEL